MGRGRIFGDRLLHPISLKRAAPRRIRKMAGKSPTSQRAADTPVRTRLNERENQTWRAIMGCAPPASSHSRIDKP